MEQANSALKYILAHTILNNPHTPLRKSLSRSVPINNRRAPPSAYIPFFLLFGTQRPNTEYLYPAHVHESIEVEELDWANKLARFHAALLARLYVNSVRLKRAKIRVYITCHMSDKKAMSV